MPVATRGRGRGRGRDPGRGRSAPPTPPRLGAHPIEDRTKALEAKVKDTQCARPRRRASDTHVSGRQPTKAVLDQKAGQLQKLLVEKNAVDFIHALGRFLKADVEYLKYQRNTPSPDGPGTFIEWRVDLMWEKDHIGRGVDRNWRDAKKAAATDALETAVSIANKQSINVVLVQEGASTAQTGSLMGFGGTAPNGPTTSGAAAETAERADDSADTWRVVVTISGAKGEGGASGRQLTDSQVAKRRRRTLKDRENVKKRKAEKRAQMEQ